MGKLRKDGIAKFGARYADKGMIVISASTLAVAREIISNDQAVIQKLFSAKVQKLNIFLMDALRDQSDHLQVVNVLSLNNLERNEITAKD